MRNQLTENSVRRIPFALVLGSISNKVFGPGVGNIRWHLTVSMIVGDDLHLAIHKNSNGWVFCAQINANYVN